MGEVWAVRDRLLGRDLALKIARPGAPRVERRLAEEVALLASLDHPGVVRVRDLGRAGPDWYLATDLLEGPRLDAWLQRSPPESAQASVLGALLGTLAWLHGQGVIHADLKPANILLVDGDPVPRPILIDFGLARAPETGPELVGGTPRYLAPELLRGQLQAPDPLTDLYGLGQSFLRQVPAGSPLAEIVRALASDDRAARPRDADEALQRLEERTGISIARRPGMRGIARLWGPRVASLAETIARGGIHRVNLAATEDGEPFAWALKAALELEGRPALWLPLDLPPSVWARLPEALGGGTAAIPFPAAPEDHPEALQRLATDLSVALASRGELPLLVLSQSGDPPPGAQVLVKRLVESGAVRDLVVSGPARRAGQEAELPGATTHAIAVPSEPELLSMLEALGIETPLPPGVRSLLLARGVAGAAALATLCTVWASRDVLTPSRGGRWRWGATATAASVDAPDLDGLWRELWQNLEDRARTVVADLAMLGGRATPRDLAEVGGAAGPGTLELLAGQGWVALEGPTLVLETGPAARIERGELTLPASDTPRRLRLIEVLERAGDRPEPLGRHLEAVGELARAGLAYRTWAERLEAELWPGRSGRAYLRAARCLALAADRDDARLAALELVDRAVRLLETGAEPFELDTALDTAREALAGLEGPRGARLFQLLSAKVALLRGELDRAVNEAGQALATSEVGESPQERFQAFLTLGTAHAHAGRTAEAATALEAAAATAEALGDAHAIGRVTNNLGTLYFQRREYARAADAYGRSHAAKRATGDLRGQRITASNRGLALREMGAFDLAWAAAREALSLAERLRDRRGLTMGWLALAELHLDLGDPRSASDALEKLAKGPDVASRVTELEAELVRARLTLERHDPADALRIAQSVRARATQAELVATAAEASRWGTLAALLAGEPLDPAGPTQSPPATPLSRGSAVLRLALEGDFSGSRALATGLPERLGPGEELLVTLVARAATLLDDEKLSRWARDAASMLLGERLEALARIGDTSGRAVPTRSEVARAFWIDDLVASPSLVTTASGTPLVDTGASLLWRQATLPRAALATPAPGEIGRPQAWCEALRGVAGAAGALIVGFTEEGLEPLPPSGEIPGGVARWEAVLTALRHRPERFVARESNDRLTALALPLLPGPGSPAVGALVLAFGAAPPSLEELEAKLAGPVAMAALALGWCSLEREVAGLRAHLARGDAEREALIAAHQQELSALSQALEQSRSAAGLRYRYDGIVHESAGMRGVLRALDRVTGLEVSVLLLGESGVGKEVCARAIHENGPRHLGPFIAENCGAVPADLFESVFFGHVRGAFTGASTASTGLIAAASGGTLFLDEVGELRPDHQVKLLRVLQERRFRPVGSQREQDADFRLVAATNKDLQGLVKDGSFREDLYYRLAVVSIEIPPLRDRPEDVIPLARRFVLAASERLGTELELSRDAADLLVHYGWPGNVRELDNEVLRAAVLAGKGSIAPKHLSDRVRGADASRQRRGPAGVRWDGKSTLEDALARVEREVLLDALHRAKGQKTVACRALGVSRPGLNAKLARHGIDAAAIRAAYKPDGSPEA
jgi:two-component system response regulator HupR/HoxA